jgi:arylsulfatase A-like enzyme
MTLNQDLALVRPPEDGLVLNHDAAAGALTGGSVWENNSLTRPETTNGTLPSKALDWTFGVMDDSNLAIGTASAYPGITAAFVFSAATGSDDGALSYTRSDGATRDSLSEIVGQGIDRSSASIESWFRPTDLSGKEVLFETGGTTDGTSLRLNGAVLEFAVRHGNNSDPGARDGFVQFDLTGTPTNEFIQAVGVIDLDGDRLRIFVNGLPRAESVFLGDDWDGGDAARLGGVGAQLGGGQGSGFGGYDGEMAILRIYDRALGDGAVVSNFLDVVGDSVNVPPVDIDLAGDAVAENQPAGTTVGTLSAVDANPGDMHTFSLVPGAGGVDNGLFSISGAVLQTSAVLDYDTQPSASIRVRATDAGGLSTEKAFELRVENLNEVDIAAQVHPNVIIYMCDDMGIGWASPYQGVKLGPAGAPIGKVLRTPQLDRLAAMGTLFTDVHTASSMCSPSRYALLTGRYAWRSYNKHFVVGGWTWPPMIAPERPTMATLFGQHGYRTAAFGKWHLGLTMLDTNGEPAVITGADEANWNKVPVGMLPGGGFVTNIYDGPCQHGFDYYFGIGQNHRNDVAGAIKAFIENNSIQGVPTWNGAPPQRGVVCQGPGVADWDQKRMGEQYMNKALDYLDAHASSGTNAPFFFYFAPNANHAPADPAVNIVVQGQSIPIKDRSRYSDGTVGDRRTDMIYENNVAVGLLLDKLSALNDPRTGRPMVDSTLFIFTSDNGPDAFGVGQAGLRDRKQSLYEGGHRVPFIVSWPDGGVPTGTVSFSRRRQRQK